jgi:hypothetical protein
MRRRDFITLLSGTVVAWPRAARAKEPDAVQRIGVLMAYPEDDSEAQNSTFSVNQLGRFRDSEVLRHVFERVVATCMAAGLVKGEGFAVDASVMEANASRYHGKAPDELDWTDAQRQKRAVAEYLAGLEAEAQDHEGKDNRGDGSDGQPTAAPDRKPPKVILPSDPSSAWRAKANKRVQFGYRLNYLIDVEHAISSQIDLLFHDADRIAWANVTIDGHRLRARQMNPRGHLH